MKGPVDVYRAEILRAVLGAGANESKVANIERLNQIAAHLVDCEDAKSILRAKGYGAAGMTFVELAKTFPENVRGMFRGFLSATRRRAFDSPAARYPGLGEVLDSWSAR